MSVELKNRHEYPFPTLGSYTNAISANLSFDGTEFFSEKSSLERFNKGEELTDPNVWVKAVDWKEGSAKKPQARIETDMGRGRTLELDANKLSQIEDGVDILDKKLPREDALNLIAFTKAKLTAIKDIIPDTYALAQTRTDGMIDGLTKAGDEILRGEQKKEVKLNNVFHKIASDNKPAYQQSISTKVTLGATTLSMALVAACSMIPEVDYNTEITPFQSTGSTVVVPTAMIDPEWVDPTPVEAVPTQMAISTPERPDFSQGVGGGYTQEQIDSISNGVFNQQEEKLYHWVEKYWGLAKNRPFHPETTELKFRYFFDQDDSREAIVTLQALGEDYQGRLFTLPIRDGEFLEIPPQMPEGDYYIPQGLGPLEVSGGEDYVLANRSGKLVRLNTSEEIAQTINKDGQWEVVETPQTVAETLRYSKEECADCVIRDLIPGHPMVRRELWSDTSGLKAYWTEESGWVPTKGWAGMLKNTVYQGRGFDKDVIQKSVNAPEYYFAGVLDGTYITDPFEIYDNAGNVLMTNKFAFPFYYLDNQDRLNSIITLNAAEIDQEYMILTGMDTPYGLMTEFGITEPIEIFDFLKSHIEGKRGKVVSLSLRENSQISEGNIWEWNETIRLTWNKYQESHSSEYGEFLKSGTGLDIIFKRNEGGEYYFNEHIINLP